MSLAIRLKKEIEIKVFCKECLSAGNQRAQVLVVTALVAALEWERGHTPTETSHSYAEKELRLLDRVFHGASGKSLPSDSNSFANMLTGEP